MPRQFLIMLSYYNNSKDRIAWSPELLAEFDIAKKSISTSKLITIPRSTDKLKIFPEWSQDADMVGGRFY